MSTSFNRFLYMVRQGTLEDDVTWRGYDIEAACDVKYVRPALKALGLSYAGEHALAHFMALYEVQFGLDAEKLLSGWWVWSRLASGRRLRGVKMRAVEGPQEGSGATTLAGDSQAGL